MSFLLVGAAVVTAGTGLVKAIQGGKAKKAAKIAEADAKVEMDAQKSKFAALDTSNPYANMENTMEDLTVNQGQAEFQKQQQQQSQANILDSMKQSAGSSGVAGLAQAMANQGSLDAQKSSISIGQQEQGNQMAERQEAGKIQGMERQGEMASRDMERNKVNTLMGMASSERSSQQQQGAAANAQMFEGMGQIASGMTAAGGVVNKAGGYGSLGSATGQENLEQKYDKDGNPV